MNLFKFLFVVALLFSSAEAQSARQQNKNNNGYFNPQRFASLVVDVSSGSIIHKENADKIRHPASLTKLMTLYLAFEGLKKGQFSMDSYVTASHHAASQPRTSIALKAGERVSVKTLIDSLVVVSANDSAVVVAEKIGGSEAGFARIMTERAHQLGMRNTTFKNASGLHHPQQVTTATDMAKLLLALKRDFPQYYHMLSLNKFSYRGVPYKAHSKLFTEYSGIKAGKTGYIAASGFNLALNASKNGEDVVAVVMGGKTANSRDNYMRSLLDKNFINLAMAKRNARGTAYASNSSGN